MSEQTDVDDDHLQDVEDGCGCAEIWETMSEKRAGSSDDTDGLEPRLEADD